MANGKVVRGFLGVEPGELTPDLAESYGVTPDAGVVVQNLVDDSPASRAGIRRGDIITAFDGSHVKDVTSFRLKVADTPVDKRVQVSLMRDGKKFEVPVTLANRDVMLAQATGRGSRDSDDGTTQGGSNSSGIGASVRQLNDREREALGPRVHAVVVTGVEEGSEAEEAGIEEGSLILEANGRDVEAPADLAAAVRQARASGRPLRVLVGQVDWNSGRINQQYVPVKIRG